MNDYLDIIPDPHAAQQLDDLINSDPQYKDEPEAYEHILARIPEEVWPGNGHARRQDVLLVSHSATSEWAASIVDLLRH